jgi:hypothetical protein
MCIEKKRYKDKNNNEYLRKLLYIVKGKHTNEQKTCTPDI